jgi:hypothetical protein
LKAIGEVSTLEAAEKLLHAGATRLGTNDGVIIIEEALRRRVREAAAGHTSPEVSDYLASAVVQRILE